MLINVVIRGASLQVVKNAYDILTPYRFLFYRFVVAGICALPVFLYFLPRLNSVVKKILIIVFIEFIGVTVALSFLYLGLTKTTSIEASLITTAGPIFTIIGGIIVLREKEERHEAIGLLISFVGTLILALVPAFQNGNSMSFSIDGSMYIVAYNILTALYFILAKKYYQNIPKFFVSAVSFYVGLISFFVLSLREVGSLNALAEVMQSEWTHFDVLLAAFYMGILGSFVALTFYFKGQDKIEASEASLFNYLQPAIYIPLGVIWLKEKVDLFQISGLIIVILGVIVASKRVRQKRKYKKRK